VIINGDTYVRRVAARSCSEWYMPFMRFSQEPRRCQSCLAYVLGDGSVLNFELVEANREPGFGYDIIEVSQCLDLSAVVAPAKVRLCLRSGHAVRHLGVRVVDGYFPANDYRFTLIRYGALRLSVRARLASLFDLDCAQLFDARGVPIASESLMLLNVRSYGSSGSIQLVSRGLGERLLRFYPSIYSA